MVYGKSCHLPVELEHKTYWAVRKLNMTPWMNQKARLMDLSYLDEFRDQAYDNSLTFKRKMKLYHDQHILLRDFCVGKKFLLFHSRLKLFPGKLKSRWLGPYVVANALPAGVVELIGKDGKNFKVNGSRLKHYMVSEELTGHDFTLEDLPSTDGQVDIAS